MTSSNDLGRPPSTGTPVLEVKLVPICRTLALVGLLLGLAACGGDGGGSPPPPDGPAQVSTLAYVVTRCHEEKGGTDSSFSQALWVGQGDRAPVKIAEFALGQPPIGGLCHRWGQAPSSPATRLLGAFQRWRFTADGSHLFFEVTDDFSISAHVVPEDQQGIFAVRPDGTGLRNVALHSKDPSFRVYWPCVFAQGGLACSSCGPLFSGGTIGPSPDGHRITYTDLGPIQTGEEAPQVFTLDLITGRRQQLTHLPLIPTSPACVGQDTECVFPSKPPISNVRFLGNTTIAYDRGRGCSPFGGGTFTVKADGSEEPQAVPVVALPGGAVVPVFQITGEPYTTVATVPGVPENEFGGPAGNTISEVFVVEPPDTAQLPGGRVLQLTNYNRSDTLQPGTSADGQRVLYIASADPLGTNPSKQCQIFSIDRLGGNLQQVTSFSATGGKARSCQDYALPGCTLNRGGVDMVTGTQVFESTCDPLGLNPNSGNQVFAIRVDGSGLVQLTQTQGVIRHADGGIDMEIAQGIEPVRVR